MSLHNIPESLCIVVSGLPASGKSTLGKKVAAALNLPLLDKDDYLEALFQERGIGDSAWRQQLSRESDLLFQRDAVASKMVVLVSHWRAIGQEGHSGTPTEWILEQFSTVIELCCVCSAEDATRRFINRKRHPGHLDDDKSPQGILTWMCDYQRNLPLTLGVTEYIETDSEIPLDRLVGRLSKQINTSIDVGK